MNKIILILLFASSTFSYDVQNNSLISPYVLYYVQKHMPFTFWPDPTWNNKNDYNYFYTMGDFNNDANLDASALLFMFDRNINTSRILALPVVFYLKNGTVESHSVVDTLSIAYKTDKSGIKIELSELKIETINKGKYTSNCGGEHEIQVPHQSLKISTKETSFIYISTPDSIKKKCYLID